MDLTSRRKGGVNQHWPVVLLLPFSVFSSSSYINQTHGISLLFIMMDVYEAQSIFLVLVLTGPGAGSVRMPEMLSAGHGRDEEPCDAYWPAKNRLLNIDH